MKTAVHERITQRNGLILASGSPRRREILDTLRFEFAVHPSTFAEDLDKSRFSPEDYCRATCLAKAHQVFYNFYHV